MSQWHVSEFKSYGYDSDYDYDNLFYKLPVTWCYMATELNKKKQTCNQLFLLLVCILESHVLKAPPLLSDLDDELGVDDEVGFLEPCIFILLKCWNAANVENLLGLAA